VIWIETSKIHDSKSGLEILMDTFKEWAETDRANRDIVGEDNPNYQYALGCEERSQQAYNMVLIAVEMAKIHGKIDPFRTYLVKTIDAVKEEMKQQTPLCKGHKNTIMPYLRYKEEHYEKILEMYDKEMPE